MNGQAQHGRAFAWEDARAIIDIGSNTVRLVVYGGPPRAPAILLNEKVTARLGKGVAENGKLSAKAVTSVIGALTRYRTLIDLVGIRQVDVVATAAARDASNGAAFLDRVRDVGFAPRLLSGVEEAETSATGVLGAFPEASGIVGDLGGGSLELVDVAQGATSHGVSLPLGSLRLGALRAGGDRAFGRKIGAMLAKADWAAEPGATLYLVGGSMRAFARAAMVRMEWPLEDTHGFTLDAAQALKLARQLMRRGQVLRPVEGVSSSRLASIPDAAALIAVLLRRLEPGRIVFSSWGLREGVLFGSLDASVQALDPLLCGVEDFVAQMGVTLPAARDTARWMGAAVPFADHPVGLAAIMLCLAAGRVEPNLRRDLASDWGLRKRWIGIDSEGRAMLAAALHANAGKAGMPDNIALLAPPDLLARARGWGLAARLCRRFGAGAAAVLHGSALVVENGQVVLRCDPPIAPLYQDGARRDLKALAAHLAPDGEAEKRA
ncbi:Exopolyphosphatase/guanosine-5'-triphosphate, 3'-diphosphate pyrophosphatase [Novosphingobium lubricantis]